jgi:hypothetical protein
MSASSATLPRTKVRVTAVGTRVKRPSRIGPATATPSSAMRSSTASEVPSSK